MDRSASDITKTNNIYINAICILLIALIFAIDLLLPLGVAGGVPYIVVLLASFWSEQRRIELVLAAACSVFVVAGFYLSPPGGELWKVVANRGLALFAIWIVTLITIKWKSQKAQIFKNNIQKEKEKKQIYEATLHSSQHILNNLFNQFQYIKIEIDNSDDFDVETTEIFDNIISEGSELMKKLSTVSNIDEVEIIESVKPN